MMPGEQDATFATERLVLQPHCEKDFADCAALWGDPAVVSLIGTGRPLTPEEVWSRLLRYVGGWWLLGYGYWAVREKGSGRFLGDVGFQNLRRASEPPLGDRPEVGWVLATEAQGRGYATEAVAGAVAWADAHLVAPETVCIIRPSHVRSLAIAARVGYGAVGSATYGDAAYTVLTRPRVFHSAAAEPTY
jgi:RimJ/RimL family protein N-acetyltransferase